MAAFERKQVQFLHKGMNWNSPVEKLQDGQFSWCKNVRILEQGSISTAHGYTPLFNVYANYIHSISRLNILNPQFHQELRRTFVVGGDQQLYVFQDQDSYNAINLNPVATPNGTYGTFSGNPLSIIDAQPVGAAVAWKYIGDSQQMCTVGYYPQDAYLQRMARALTIGLDPPINTSAVTISTYIVNDPSDPHHGSQFTTPGNLSGDYQWAFAYRRKYTGARSNPSAATRQSAAVPALHLLNNQVTMGLPGTPLDPQTGQPDVNVVIDVYRFGGVIFRWALVGSGPPFSIFTDNVPDENLLAAPAPSQITDASTGLTRFNLFRPFVTQDIQHTGSAMLEIRSVTGIALLNTAGQTQFDVFNIQWLAGSTIYVNDGTHAAPGIACTIYQVQNETLIELQDDLTGGQTTPPFKGVLQAGPVTWTIPAGTLMTGQPLPHLWGPYGIGFSGSYVFACGDRNSPGTLYWTNGNDPDSTDIVNNIQVTSPSEKLMTGCVYDGQPYCWSTERQFQIFPSLTIFGQFTAQELAGAKGVWMEWSLSVQSNGISDQSVSWRGKDGIYDWSSNGLQRLTDPLYAFFPHDNNPSLAPETILADIIGANTAHPEHVGNLDDTQPKYHRLCWFHGLLFYDFVALSLLNGSGTVTYSTLVWDTVNIPGGGWVSLDQPFSSPIHPIGRGIQIGANDPTVDALEPEILYGPIERGGSMLIGWGTQIFDYYGFTRGFQSRVITRAEDIGDSRAQKRWGDYWLDCTPLNEFTVYPMAGFSRCLLQPVTVPGSETAITPDFCPHQQEPGVRAQFILDFQEFKNKEGAALMSPSLGLDIIWSGIDSPFAASIYQWGPSYVLKPEIISFRATDPDDLQVVQAKYFTGLNLEANTFGQDTLLNVLLDNNLISQLNVNHNGQSEKPYAFTPKAGYETQLQMNAPQDINGQPVTWQLFKINWIYEVWPDSVARDSFFTNCGYVGAKFMQGAVIPMETGGNPVSFQVNSDCGQSVTLGPVSTPNLCKNDIAFSFSPCNASPSDPFIAHELQIAPDSAARIWYDQIKWIWEPEPELVATWDTQPTDHDLPGWHSLRDCYIAYRGGTGAPVLTITTEYGSMSYVLDPVVDGQYVRCYRVLAPQKAKWRQYRVESCGLFRLYMKDCEVRAKAWGDAGPYKSFAPFGDLSRANGGARI